MAQSDPATSNEGAILPFQHKHKEKGCAISTQSKQGVKPAELSTAVSYEKLSLDELMSEELIAGAKHLWIWNEIGRRLLAGVSREKLMETYGFGKSKASKCEKIAKAYKSNGWFKAQVNSGLWSCTEAYTQAGEVLGVVATSRQVVSDIDREVARIEKMTPAQQRQLRKRLGW